MNSWTRTSSSNNFLFDAGSELNKTTNLHDLPHRNCDATLPQFESCELPFGRLDIYLSSFFRIVVFVCHHLINSITFPRTSFVFQSLIQRVCYLTSYQP